MPMKSSREPKIALALLLVAGIVLLVASGLMRDVSENTSISLFTFGITIFLLGIFFYLIYNMLCLSRI